MTPHTRTTPAVEAGDAQEIVGTIRTDFTSTVGPSPVEQVTAHRGRVWSATFRGDGTSGRYRACHEEFVRTGAQASGPHGFRSASELPGDACTCSSCIALEALRLELAA